VYRGNPEQAEEAYNTLRARHPEFDLPAFKDLPSEAIRRGSYDKINVGLTDHFRPAEITAAKAALGACVLAYGPAFAVSDFAAALRAIQDDQAPPQEQLGGQSTLEGLDAHISASAAHLGLDAAGISRMPQLVPAAGETVHDVILVPVGQRTVLFVHSMSALVPPYGIVIKAALPQLTPGMPTVAPILLRDGGARNRLEITDFSQLLMQPALDALILPEEDEDDSPRPES
jgi:hypothetical protein